MSSRSRFASGVLGAIDLSEMSEFALAYAGMRARALGARVTALHVVQATPGMLLEETGMDYSPAGLKEKDDGASERARA